MNLEEKLLQIKGKYKELETRLIGSLIPPCNADIRDVAVKERVKAFAEF